MRWVTDTIERSCVQASQKYEKIPDDIIVSFSSSSFISDILTVQYVRSDETELIQMQEIDTMIKKIESESFARARKKCKQQFGLAHDDIRLVSSTVINIVIDDKIVTNPVGFSGRYVRLSILNVFSSASEFNIVRSIVSRLGKRTISLVPTPLIFPKLLETSEYSHENGCILDIGYSHTTILLVDDNRIISFETFPVGSEMLSEIIAESHPELSWIQIENLLCGGDVSISIDDEIRQFLEYLMDAVGGFFENQNYWTQKKHIFCYGWFFENKHSFWVFSEFFTHLFWPGIRKHRLIDVIEAPENNDKMLTYGLALIAQELLLVKKDPVVRILRYVLYNYE